MDEGEDFVGLLFWLVFVMGGKTEGTVRGGGVREGMYHFNDYGVGVRVGHHACERASACHAEPARVVD